MHTLCWLGYSGNRVAEDEQYLRPRLRASPRHMALAARTDEPLAEAQALATGIATAGLSRLVELGGSVLSAQ